MNVLILTSSEEHKKFMVDVFSRNKGAYPENIFMHWFDNEFIFMEPLTTWYDIGISFMYQHKVPAKEVNTHKWFNFHPAPLPAYRGRNLCYHAIMNGEKEFGASVHYMDENFDTGAIIDVWHFPIHDWMTAEDVSKSAIEASQALFEEYLPQILAGEDFTTLPNVGGRYYKKEPIGDFVGTSEYQDDRIRAITYKDFYPKIAIGGVVYKIVRDE